VRLCGVSVTSLEDHHQPKQLSFDEPTRARGERLGQTLDDIHRRFGDAAIGRALINRSSGGKNIDS
jgi:hypothetical protein